MKLGLLPGGVSGSGGPSTYVIGVALGLARQPHIRVDPLLLGLRQVTPRGRAQRRLVCELLGSGVGQVRGRPVGRRLHASGLRALLPRYDCLFGKHDVYHQTHLDVDPLVPGERLVLTLHDLVAERWPDEGGLLPGAEHLLCRAAAVITVSTASKKIIQARFPELNPDRLHVIWNGVDHSIFHPEQLPHEQDQIERLGVPGRYLLYVGGLSMRKNLSTLLDAYKSVRDLHPEGPDLVLIGPWHRDGLLAAQGRDGVVVLGSVPSGAVASLMRGAVAVVIPSRDEGFGLPVLEAQACGTPIVCSDIDAFTEVGGDAPYYVDTSSVEALVAALRDVLPRLDQERSARTDMGIGHAAQFSWDRSAAAHRVVYDQVMRQARDQRKDRSIRRRISTC